MTSLQPVRNQRARIVAALLIASIIFAGSIFVAMFVRTGGFRQGVAYNEGTVMSVARSMTGGIAVVGDNLLIVVESGGQADTTMRFDTQGFREDTRAPADTVGLRVDSTAANAANRMTVVVPTDGSLVLTLVGEARIILQRARMDRLQLAGASASLEVDASTPGSVVDTVILDGVAGDFRGVRLGNLNFAELTVGDVAGNFDLDLSGALERRGDVVVRSALGDGTIRVPSAPGAEIRIGSVLGRVTATGLTATGARSFVNAAASLGAESRLIVDVRSTIGKIQLLEVQ